MSSSSNILKAAFETRDISEFMSLLFPPEWEAIAARILESGATLSVGDCRWAPRWSKIPPTVRPKGTPAAPIELELKSCIFRVHDCLHQLWGLPRPDDFSDASRRLFKKAQLCGEVAVLTITEFVFCRHLAERFPELSTMLHQRNALPLLSGPMALCSLNQIASRLDGLLHKKIRPDWVRANESASAFCDDYVPMLERDRIENDHNWQVMENNNWLPSHDFPNARYNPLLDGQELTLWMMDDFEHLKKTGIGVDESLMRFNRKRRESLVLPDGWGLLS